MVDLFNRIDEASRADLERLNEANALRFEAKLDQRAAELRAAIIGVDERLSARIASLDERLSARLDSLDTRVTALESSVAALDKRVSDLPAVLEKALHTQTRWMIAGYAGIIAMVLPSGSASDRRRGIRRQPPAMSAETVGMS